MSDFIGRDQELALLKEVILKEKSTISVVYGRRRVGKSALIRRATQGKESYFFEGLENQPQMRQITNFVAQLAYQTKKAPPLKMPKEWRDVFLELVDIVKGKSVVLVFDEFQWTANYRSEIVAHLKMVWDQYLSQAGKVTLILCGSIASFMIKKVVGSSALFGRSDLVLHLKPFQLDETRQLLAGRSDEEILEAHMLVGGIPQYLEFLHQEPSIYQGIQKLAFQPHGYFLDEYDRIFTSHFGKNSDFKKIVETLSSHPYGLSRHQLCNLTGIEAGGGLTQQLYDLETAGFVQSYRPFDKTGHSKQLRYCLKDAYIRFYFSFIRRHLQKIEGGLEDLFYRIIQQSAYLSWLGRTFEYTCQDHAKKISRILGFSGIDYTFGPYFKSSSTTKKGVQIDLLFDRADRVVSLCEIKYTRTPPGLELIDETERKVDLLRLKTRKTIQKILITKTAPSPPLVRKGYFYKIIPARALLERGS